MWDRENPYISIKERASIENETITPKFSRIQRIGAWRSTMMTGTEVVTGLPRLIVWLTRLNLLARPDPYQTNPVQVRCAITDLITSSNFSEGANDRIGRRDLHHPSSK